MPNAPPTLCHCGLPKQGGKCPRCGARPSDRNRKNFRQRGYTWEWSKASALFLKKNPLCKPCQDKGIATGAFATDHIIPHKGNMELFWDVSNWQPICRRCHAAKSATE